MHMPEAIETTLARQREAPRALARLIADVPTAALRQPPAPGKWCVVAVLAHLAEDELSSSWRYRQMLENPGVALASFDQEEWARRGEYALWDTHEAPSRCSACCAKPTFACSPGSRPEEWQRWGAHAERGRLTVAELARST